MPTKRKIWLSTIFPKLIAAFLLVIAPLYVLGVVINMLGESSVKKEVSSSLESRVEYFIRSLETEKEHMQQLQRENIIDKDLLHISDLSETMTLFEWSETVKRLHNKLQIIRGSSIYIKNVNVYLMTIGRTITTHHPISDGIDADYEAVKPIEGVDSREFRYWNGRLFLGLPYPEAQILSRIKPSYIFSIELDTGELKRALGQVADYEHSGAVLVNPKQGWTLAGDKDAELLQELTPFLQEKFAQSVRHGIDPIRFNGERYLAVYRYSSEFGAFLCLYVPQSQVFGQIGTYRGLYVLLSILSAAVIFAYSYWIYRLIHRPLRTLVRSFRKVEEGQMDPAPLPRSNDEFLYLFQRFNMMIERLKVLIQQVYEQKIRAQSSELKQLQSQINPHFLYNTYFILFRLAKKNDNANVARFSQYLGEYFLYITRGAENNVPLEAEVKHARTYMEIQNMRFQDRISVDFEDLPDACRNVPAPKLILQPVIENAYKHGLEKKRKNGVIRVSFDYDTESVLITVEDNGDNLSDEQLINLEQELADDSLDKDYSGLLNVHRRLQILYGEQGGIAVSRGGMGGLNVTLKLLPGMPEQR